ncbi:hypothetical protein V9K67_21810 [Paraflavisolibacter sp. H34]|uniref:hypothetical protein n=1 Tax=Huijunlia imazamoxiresistens TaxID=3127457 RepID=UPI003017F6A8
MKLLLLTLHLLLFSVMHAQQITFQEAEQYANKLVAREILSKKGREVLLKNITDRRIETEFPSTVKGLTYVSDTLSKETLLEFCAGAFYTEQVDRLVKRPALEEKIPAEDSLAYKGWMSFSPQLGMGKAYVDCISPKRSILGKTRTRTLNDFRDIGLISPAVYEDCKKALLDSTVKDEVELLHLMVKRSLYYRYYDFHKNEQAEYIEMLANAGLFTPAEKDALLRSYEPLKLKTIPEMLSFRHRYVLVDLEKVEADPQVIYPIIFQAVQKLIPQFSYRDLQVRCEETSESDLIREDLVLHFDVGDTRYAHRFFHDYRKKVPEPADSLLPLQKVDQDFHKGINKWLTERNESYRLYTVNLPGKGEGAYGEKRVGLLLLRNGEAEKISKDPYLLSRESYDNRLSQSSIDRLVEEFSREGFFSHVTKQEMDSARQVISLTEVGSIEDVLLCIPNTIVLFDWETGNLENPYEELTMRFAAASRGAFTPAHVVDEFRKGWKKAKRVMYSFEFRDRKYQANLPFKGDWLEPEFMELIKKALRENSVDGGLYYCVDNGQESGFIFLTSKQYRFIQEHYPDLLKEE